MKRRRKRVKHYNLPGHAHFLTFSCRGRIPLFSKDRTRYWLLDSLNKARSRHCFDLWAWVIMPEHVHLLIHPRRAIYDMDLILTSIKQPTAARALAFLREHAPKFLERLTLRRGGRTTEHFWQ